MPASVPELPHSREALSALLLAVDPRGLGGAVIDHPLHEVARAFAEIVRQLLPNGARLRRVPTSVTADRLYGGVDLAATLRTGKVVAERGVLAGADGGVLIAPMAERLGVAARTAICEALDHAEIRVARDGIGERHAAQVCALLLDESVDDEVLHDSLRDRVAFSLTLEGAVADEILAMAQPLQRDGLVSLVREARRCAIGISMDEQWVTALCQTADAFGVDSARAALFAVRTARALAALRGRLMVTEADAELAAALVLAPRATRLPPAEPEPDREETAQSEPSSSASPEPSPSPASPESQDDRSGENDATSAADDRGSLLRDAVQVALPPQLLEQLMHRSASGAMAGRVGSEKVSMLRGRPRGSRGGVRRGGARLHRLETGRAAARWKTVRAAATTPSVVPTTRVAVRREDFRIRRFIEKTGTTVLFVVDASGSSALHRLAEAKGAVELLLAETYARRDRVSLLAFRGQGTEVLLPPTRALARARRVLAALPGGGGTPLAHAIDAAIEQALGVRRGGSAPLAVFMTDGRANIARDGQPGRKQAEQDALLAGARFAALRIPALLIDTSPRGEPLAKRIAQAMSARYIVLPVADAHALNGLVRTAMHSSDSGSRG